VWSKGRWGYIYRSWGTGRANGKLSLKSTIILEWNSTCFGQFVFPSSGVFYCTHSNGIGHTGLPTACELEHLLLLTSCQQTCMTYTIAMCTVENSWWWKKELSETCRISFQNKFEKLVHLVGFVSRIFHDARSYESKKKNVSFDIKHFWICPPSPPQGVPNFTTVRMTSIYVPKQHQLNGVGSKVALLFWLEETALPLVIPMNSLLQGVSNFATLNSNKTWNLITGSS
jgi:hypothetical protein